MKIPKIGAHITGLYNGMLVRVRESCFKYNDEEGLPWTEDMFLLLGKIGRIKEVFLSWADVDFEPSRYNCKYPVVPGTYRLSKRGLTPQRSNAMHILRRNVLLAKKVADITASVDPLAEGAVIRHTRSSTYINPYPITEWVKHDAFKRAWFRKNEVYKERCLKELVLLLGQKNSKLLLDEKFARNIRTNKMDKVIPLLTDREEIRILAKYGFKELGYDLNDEKEFTNNPIFT